MSRITRLALPLVAVAAGGMGYVVGRGPESGLIDHMRGQLLAWVGLAKPVPARTKPTAPVIYFQDPDGRPIYSPASKVTGDGRAFRAVHAHEDVDFDGEAKVTPSTKPGGGKPAAGGRKLLYYRNPMGLPDTSPGPKKDSMGMDYIPVYEGEDGDGAVVKISPGKVQRTGVRTEVVERRIVSQPVRVPGTVALDERRISVVATRADAYVESVENITTGDWVHKGAPLMRVYSAEITAAAAQLVASPGYDGARRRLQNLNVSDAVIDEMERTRKVPRAIAWSAPRDGIVLQRSAVEGMKAAAGDTLFRIGDISVVWVLADVPEHDLAAIRVGQAATVRLRSAPGRAFSGKVGVIYPQVNAETRAARVRIELPNPDGALLPDMYAEVEIATGSGTPVVAIPVDALIDTGETQIVLLDRGEGRFEPHRVEVGARGPSHVAIRAGLEVGDKVVTGANFLIDAESNLKAALQGMATASSGGGRQADAGASP